MSMTDRPATYDLLEDFDLSSEFKQAAPPYLQQDPPTYKLRPHLPRGHRPRAIAGEPSPGAGPEDARLSGFDLAESIWSRDSDLTLEDLPLDSDSAHSSASSHWSAPPLTPPTASRHLPPVEPALASTPLSVQIPAQGEVVKPDEPASPAPAYSRDPLEFDPALLASLESQLRLRPFEAFEDMCWASFPDSAPAEAAHSLPPRSASLSRHHPSASCTNFTVHSSYSDSSMATMLAPPLPPLPPSHPPPAYPASKPLPTLPPPSPLRSTAEDTHTLPTPNAPQIPLEAPAAEPSVVLNEDLPVPAAMSGTTVQFFPLRPPLRPRSKSVGGTRTVKRLTTALARLRGRE